MDTYKKVEGDEIKSFQYFRMYEFKFQLFAAEDRDFFSRRPAEWVSNLLHY